MTLEELEELREGWEFEAKAARTKLPKSIWETYSAMANTTGGRIALGVVEGRDGSLELQGIENVHDVLKDLWSTLENRSAVSVNLLGRDDVQQHSFKGRDYIDKPDSDVDSPRWADRVAPDGTWNANIWEFYLRVEPLLMQGLQTPFYLEPGSFARKDSTDIHTAVREAFVNTLVHADYHGLAGVRVIKQRTSYRFVNDGVMLISQDQFWQGGVSQTRNPALQGFFTMLRLGEREGSGGLTIQSAWTNNHLEPPKLQQDFEHSQTALELSLTTLFAKEVLQVLSERLGAAFSQQDELGRTILALAESRRSITHKDIANIHAAHSRDITLKLQELQSLGMIVSHGKGRGTSYSTTNVSRFKQSDPFGFLQEEQFILGTNPMNVTTGIHPPSADLEPVSLVHSDPSSTLTSESSAIKSESSAIKNESSAIKNESPAIKNESPATHDSVQQVASSRRASRPLVRAAVLALCSNDFLRIEAIATHLHRNARGLRHDYIIPMLNEGLLVAQYPSTPNHPNQAYKTAPAVENAP